MTRRGKRWSQSTGVYWVPLYDLLEARGFNIRLANARHTKNLPGRKSDVQESQWLMKLHTYGLPRGARGAAHAEGPDHDECAVVQRDE